MVETSQEHKCVRGLRNHKSDLIPTNKVAKIGSMPFTAFQTSGGIKENHSKTIDRLREIGSRVGRNQTTVMRICDRWMQEGTTDRHGRSHPPQCTTSREDRQIERIAVTDLSVTAHCTVRSTGH
ncbi:transposable element Tcb1 transposase [Trichonephila clavipes]|nr:transposable element Tcb1 transposase [Trichonephila clavipes]